MVHRPVQQNLRQRSAGWSSEAAHCDGASSELRRGSLPDLGGSYPRAGASVMHRTSWHAQQPMQLQQIMQQVAARTAPPPPPPQQQRQMRLLSGGAPPPPPPRVLSPHAQAALTLHQGSNGSPPREPTVPFGSPALRSRLAYGTAGASYPLPRSGLTAASGYPAQHQATALGDSPVNPFIQSRNGLDAEATSEEQARSA